MIAPVLFLFLFLIPNIFGWVESSFVELAGMVAISIYLYIAGWFVRNSAVAVRESMWLDRVVLVLLLSLIFFLFSFKSSAIFSALRDGYSEEARENALKLAPPLFQVLVNILRDALLPFMLIITYRKRKILFLSFVLLYVYFAAFNLAKSFLIINTIALVLACNSRFSLRLVIGLCGIFLFASLIMGGVIGAFDDINGYYQFVFDFVARRILTLTPELGVGVRDMVDLHGFYWFSSHDMPFEMQLYRFIGHSDLESGWANVFVIADAYGRGGLVGIFLAFFALSLYAGWFLYLKKFLGSIYSLYLINLFSIYVFMQGIYSFGLIASFFVGPLFLLFCGGSVSFFRSNIRFSNSKQSCSSR